MAKYTNTATHNTKKHPGTGHTCGECSRGTWSAKHTNHTPSGQPFLKECEYSRWSTNAEGKNVTLTSTQACEKFKGQ